MKHRTILFTQILLIFCSLTGCQTTIASTWERSPPEEIAFQKLDLEYRQVTQDRFNEAVSSLSEKSVSVLSDSEYFHFVGESKTDSRKALLIRTTVKAFSPTGYDFYIGANNELYAHHGVLSRYDVSMSWPIVIFLDSIPTDLWTDCNSAG